MAAVLSPRFVAALLLIPLGLAAAEPVAAEPAKPRTPVEARKKVGEEIVIEMTVQAAKDRLENRGEIYLDAEADFRDEKNFAVVINREGASLFNLQGVRDFEEHFRGKTIRAKGVVTVVDEVPRIEVSDPKQIEMITKK